jgi:S-adenosylmethionine-diacylglycerol 3-amino-3-carboxypropyl transferase
MDKYFKDLNYSLANEDTTVESELLKKIKMDRLKILCVAGSGSRVLPLIHNKIKNIQIVDLSLLQLQLTRLRISAAQKLDRSEFLALLGYTNIDVDRVILLKKLDLAEDELQMWLMNKKILDKGIIFNGRWEKFLLKLGQLFRLIFQVDLLPLFNLQSYEERREWYDSNFPKKRLQLFLKICANPFIFNLLLYKGGFAKSSEKFSDFLQKVFFQILVTKNPRQSFFAQMIFLGDIPYEEGWPIETKQEVLDSLKSFNGTIEYHQTELLAYLKANPDYHFLSLSDVPSYLTLEQQLMLEKSLITNSLNPSCAVMRSFRRHPSFTDGFVKKFNKEDQNWAAHQDTIGVYKFHIFENT